MSRTLSTITVVVAVAVLASCSERSLVGPNPALSRGASAGPAAAPSRPAGGTCTFVSTVLPPEPGQPPNVLRFSIEEVCHLRHLGLTTAVAEETATLSPTGSVAVFTTVYTAANGDQLFTTSSVTGTPPDQGVISFSGTETVTGGTGRFADASGSFSLTASVTQATRTGRIELSGTLSY